MVLVVKPHNQDKEMWCSRHLHLEDDDGRISQPLPGECGSFVIQADRTRLDSRCCWAGTGENRGGTDAYIAELQVSVGAADKDNTAVDFAIVTGPGLPAAGLFMRRSTGACSVLTITAQLAASDVTGNDATVAEGNYLRRANCTTRFRLAGVAVNPANQASFSWPSSNRNYLSTPLSDAQVTAIGPFSQYNFRVYQHGVATAPAYNYNMRIRTGLIAPTDMRSYQWQDIAQTTLNALDPTNAAAYTTATTFPITWTSKAGLPSVFNVNVQVLAGAGASIVDGSIGRRPVLPGTTVTAFIPPTSPATSFPSVTNMVSGQGNFSFAALQWQNPSGLIFNSSYEYDR